MILNVVLGFFLNNLLSVRVLLSKYLNFAVMFLIDKFIQFLYKAVLNVEVLNGV